MATHSHCSSAGCCGSVPSENPGFARRDFLKRLLAGAALASAHPLSSMAGPFTREDFTRLVPADKKLDAEWLRSLTERGQPQVYRGDDLRRIGMPVGGIGAGHVYLGGDGKLWHWDIFNQHINTGSGGPHYAKPMEPATPFDQGFALNITSGPGQGRRTMDATGWSDIRFRGEYPIGRVEFGDEACPVAVELNAWSPFIPLKTDDSSLPAIVMEYTVRNTGKERVRADFSAWMENAVGGRGQEIRSIQRRNRTGLRGGWTFLECSAELAPEPITTTREDILFDDFERETYGDWTSEGSAFGAGPVVEADIPGYQGPLGAHGKRAVNTHSAPTGDVGQRDSHLGTLTSREFTIERKFINFLIGGGRHAGTRVSLVVEGQTVLSASGKDDNQMQPHSFRVEPWLGKKARLQLVDSERGPWGNIGIDYIVLSDSPTLRTTPFEQSSDYGTMSLLALGRARTSADVRQPGKTLATSPKGQKLAGEVVQSLDLKPGRSQRLVFIIAWHFPNLRLPGLKDHRGRWYATRYSNALDVGTHLASDYKSFRSQTFLWRETWYDSSLPFWFLDRTFLNSSILATSTCYRFGDGRFYGWEGVGCCPGTCTHVWQYAQAVARLFPDLERSLRERVDYGVALQPDGRMFFRAEHNNHWALDGQCGIILRTLREHQHSADMAFLKRVWPETKKALEFVISRDEGTDGIVDGPQHNTLDADWWGENAWLSGMYLAALRAAQEMATEIGDTEFAAKCQRIVDTGRQRLVERLFDGEYFINKVDPAHKDSINSGTGCHIDQVFGQSWAFQVGLGRVLPPAETLASLKSLWRYNFTPDVGPYRQEMKQGRWYAMPGEAGLLMCTFPRNDWDYQRASGKGPDWAAGYFNECMNGFEYQVAGHMIWEGLTTEGLAVARAVHDRYDGSRRNPWNEIECGDHYARSMASYGVYLAACGFEYHGPRGHIAFAPSIHPENFRCAFTAAEGWGSYEQTRSAAAMLATLSVKHGRLMLKSISLSAPDELKTVEVLCAGRRMPCTSRRADGKLRVELEKKVTLQMGEKCVINIH